MAKGYWLAQVEVTDPEGYKSYVAANQIAFRQYGARYVVRAGRRATGVPAVLLQGLAPQGHVPGREARIPVRRDRGSDL